MGIGFGRDRVASGIVPETSTELRAEDPNQVRNKSNYQRLNKISEDLLAKAIGIFKTMTPLQARNFRMRNLRWHGGTLRENDEWGDKTGRVIAEFDGEKNLIQHWLNVHCNPDNWELVQIGEPSFTEKGEQPREFVEAIADSEGDTWPDEKRALYVFVTANVSPENRHLVKLLNYGDLREIKDKRQPKVIR